MSMIQKSIQGTLWLTISRFVSIAIGAASTIFIVRWLGPQEYGYIPLVSSILGIAMIFGDAGIAPSTSYYLAQHQDNKRYSSALLFKTLKLRILIVIPLCIILIYCMPYIFILLKAPLMKDKLIIVIGSLFFIQVMSRWTGKAYEGLGETGYMAKSQVYLSWLSPASQLLLVAMGFGVFGAISGQAFGNAIVVTMLLILLLKKYKGNNTTGHIDVPVSYAQIIRYAIPLMVIHASFFIYMQSDILILKYFRDIQEVSYYGLITHLAILTQIPILSFGNSTAPLIVSARKESLEKASGLVRQSLRYIVIAYAPAALFLYVLAPELITVCFSKNYLPSVPILRIYIPFIFCFAIAGFASLALDYTGKARLRMVFVSISAAINVGLNLWLIPRFGMVGAAWATQATYVPLVMIYIYFLVSHYHISLKGLYSFSIKLFCALIISGILLVLIQSIIGTNYIALIVEICFATVLYGALLFLLNIMNLNECKELLRKINLAMKSVLTMDPSKSQAT